MSSPRPLTIRNARVNNLRGVSVEIPREQLTVFTGVSGSGKSSLVFGTIAVESQRQLNETFTWFVRNRLPKHEKPDAEEISNLTTAIVVDQKPLGGNSRSTVGTLTDIWSTLRVLFSRHGTPSAGEASAYSFNDPAGMCPECHGLGRTHRLDLERALDRSLSLNQGAVRLPQSQPGTWQWSQFAESGLFDPDKAVAEYSEDELKLLLYGDGITVERPDGRGGTYRNSYQGLVVRFERLYLKRDTSGMSARTREAAAEFTVEGLCPACRGARLNPAALATVIDGRSIADYARMEAGDLADVLAGITDPVAAPIARAAEHALRRIVEIGLGYLTLDRETAGLSGGEAQRLKTVRHLGSSLTGMTYVFDEPSTGLHPADVGRLGVLLRRLRDQGNTVLVVEHDRDVIAGADHVVDLGPGAGVHGGLITYQGDTAGLRASDTRTGRELRTVRPLKPAAEVRRASGTAAAVGPLTRHNLRGVSVEIPAGVLTAITGVAGSGKSTLLDAVAAAAPDAVVVDQSAIGANARSTPLSYTGALDPVRRLFARANRVPAALFSFNSRGACPECGGRGETTTDLAFMDPVTTRCEGCGGRRFRAEVLAHRLRGLSIADLLELTAEQAADFLADGAREHGGRDWAEAARKVRGLADTGLGYLTLGRSVSTLSGGERQRVKLATVLDRRGAVYILDEPTTGLHMADVAALVDLLDRLVDAGNTVVVVEHDLDVVKRADHVVDLGPGGGKHGGRVLYRGPVPGLLGVAGSPTAAHLRSALPGAGAA